MSYTSAEALMDTNVLVYAWDLDAPSKQRTALEIIESARQGRQLAVSTQVLAEYVSVMTRKFLHGMTPERALAQLIGFSQVFDVYPVTFRIVTEATIGFKRHGFSYYDAQIWAVARLNGIPLVISEDFEHGRVVEGVRFENPFLAELPRHP